MSAGAEGWQMVGRDFAADVMPLVDAATASGASTAQEFPRILAFNLFGQGVAFYQATQALIAAGQPAEALPLLRELVIITAPFEQVADAGTLGLLVRLALDTLREGSPAVLAAAASVARESLIQQASSADLRIPESLPPPEGTATWRALAAEMRLAQAMAESSLAGAGLHVSFGSENRADFRTRLQPGPLTDLIMSASVIAQLQLLKHAAPLFGWAVDDDKVDVLLAEARDANDRAAAAQMQQYPAP